MKHIRRFNESDEVSNLDENVIDFDFLKAQFIPKDKTIVGAYFITKRNEKSIEVLNLREQPNHLATYMDNATPYTIKMPSRCILPTSQIKILKEVEGREGFFFIQIPYWLYKKDEGLVINRYAKKKRFDPGRTFEDLKRGSTDEYKKEYLTKMLDKNVDSYLRASDDDSEIDLQLRNFKRVAEHLLKSL